jgi:hypothetical protein
MMAANFGGALLARLEDLLSGLIARLPIVDYVAALILVLFGLFLAKVVYVLVIALADLLRLDRLAERAGAYDILEGTCRDTPSRLFGRILYWLTLAFFLAAAIDALQIIDVPLQMESFAGLAGRVFSFAILLLLADLFGRFAGAVADALLRIVDHPVAGRGGDAVHLAFTISAAITMSPVLGLDPSTTGGAIIFALAGVIGAAAAITAIVLHLRRREIHRRLLERFRVGDRIALPDGRSAVIRHLGDDHLQAAADDEEWLMPAAWVLDAPVRKEEL